MKKRIQIPLPSSFLQHLITSKDFKNFFSDRNVTEKPGIYIKSIIADLENQGIKSLLGLSYHPNEVAAFRRKYFIENENIEYVKVTLHGTWATAIQDLSDLNLRHINQQLLYILIPTLNKIA